MTYKKILTSKTGEDPDLAKFHVSSNQTLDLYHLNYNPLVHLLRVSFCPRYSNPLLKFFFKHYKVHSIRDSVIYALRLLHECDSAKNLKASKIILKILSLQNTNPQSSCYGNWPKYLEETWSGISRPDPNWAYFLGAYLLEIIFHHHQQLPVEVITEIDGAILRAAQAIKLRDVDLAYTNIAVRGIYVVLTAGEIYKIDNLYEYGLQKLQQFYQYTMQQGGFTEYNSPNYEMVTLDALGRLRLHVQSEQAQVWIKDLYQLTWENIAYHFHPPTQQWAGPHSRSYSTLLNPYILAVIEKGTSNQVRYELPKQVLLESELGISLPCPVELEPFFLQIDQPRTLLSSITHECPYRTLTTYMTSDFTLGSVSYSDFWHQRRPLLAYWGTPQKPAYLRLRFLCDGDDFAAAQFVSVQREGKVLAGLTFATDVDKRNPYIVAKMEQSLIASDLRLRFELMGTVVQLSNVEQQSTLLECCIENLWVQLVIVYSQFRENIGYWEITQEGSKLFLDWVLLSGKRQIINLKTLVAAAIGMGVSLSHQSEVITLPRLSMNDKNVDLDWQSLFLSFMIYPNKQAVLLEHMQSRNLKK